MIIHVESNTPDSLASVKDSLHELAGSWGYQLREIPANTPKTGDSSGNHKSVDPVAIAALILSIPSASLAVTDLADRIHKRRRAQNLIDNAKQATDDHTTIKLITDDGPQDVATMDADQLLDLPKPEDPPA